MFVDRYHAGKVLAEKLLKYIKEKNFSTKDIVVVALLRWWLPVAFELIKKLKSNWFVLPVKKISSPFNEEVAIWAIAPDGSYFLDKSYISYLGLNEDEIAFQIKKSYKKVLDRMKKYHVVLPDLKNKIVILIDDWIATWATSKIAAKFLKNKGAKKIILAVPVCPFYLEKDLFNYFDDIICLYPIENFSAVGQGYQKFDQVEDEEVFNLINDLKDER